MTESPEVSAEELLCAKILLRRTGAASKGWEMSGDPTIADPAEQAQSNFRRELRTLQDYFIQAALACERYMEGSRAD
jgi:hypothetical protein